MTLGTLDKTTDPGTALPPVPPGPIAPVTPVTPTLPTGLPPSDEQRDALAYIRNVLDQYGLGSEADWAWSQIVEGVGQTQLLQALRQRDTYKQRFSGMAQRQANGLPAISEAEYIQYERQAYQLMLAAGLPEEFRSQDYLSRLIGQDRSINELQQNIANAYLAVTQAPPEVRQTFGQYFGPQSDQAFAAFILDGEHAAPALESMANQAIVGGTGQQYGFNVGQGLAEQIVQRGMTGQARQTFEQIASQRSLFRETVSEAEDITEEQGVQAGFGTAQSEVGRIRRRQEQRAAEFGGTAGGVVTQEGAIGLGAARQ
jgi:hypothetical protein